MKSGPAVEIAREYGPGVLGLVIIVFAGVGVHAVFFADQPTPERTGTIACETDDGVSLITYNEYEAPKDVQDEIDLCEDKLNEYGGVLDAHDFGYRGGSR